MVEQCGGALEGLGTEVAAVGPLIVVAALVVRQPGRPAEALAADQTFEGMVRLLLVLGRHRHRRRRHHLQNHLLAALHHLLLPLHELPWLTLVLAVLPRAQQGWEGRQRGGGLAR